MIVMKLIERNGATEHGVEMIEVDVNIGESEGNAFSFVTAHAGTLKMRATSWPFLLKAIQKGATRPLIVFSEASNG